MFIPDMTVIERALKAVKGGAKKSGSDSDSSMIQSVNNSLVDQVIEKEIYNQINGSAYSDILLEKFNKLNNEFTNSSAMFKDLLEAYDQNASVTNKTSLIQHYVLLESLVTNLEKFITNIVMKLPNDPTTINDTLAAITLTKSDMSKLESRLGAEIHTEKVKLQKIVNDIQTDVGFIPLTIEETLQGILPPAEEEEGAPEEGAPEEGAPEEGAPEVAARVPGSGGRRRRYSQRNSRRSTSERHARDSPHKKLRIHH